MDDSDVVVSEVSWLGGLPAFTDCCGGNCCRPARYGASVAAIGAAALLEQFTEAGYEGDGECA